MNVTLILIALILWVTHSLDSGVNIIIWFTCLLAGYFISFDMLFILDRGSDHKMTLRADLVLLRTALGTSSVATVIVVNE